MPRQLKEILHAKGISLVGALAAAGILGGLAMVFAQLTKQQMQAQKRAETGVEIVALSQRVVRTLYDGKACINTLGAGKNITPQASFGLDAIKNKDNQVVYQALTSNPNAPSYGNRLLKVASLKLVVNTNPNPIPGDQAGAMLEVTLQKISSAYTGQVETVKKFPVTLELDTAKNLVGCVSDISAVADPVKEAICKEIGGTTAWDTSTKTCTFGACPSGEYLEGFDTSGRVCKSLPQIADMACAQQGWAVTKFQNGVPVCEEVIPATTPSNNQNNPTCASLGNNAILTGLSQSLTTAFVTEDHPGDTCADKTTASKNLCSSSVTTYTEYTPLGGCYAGGNVVSCSGAECVASNAGNSLEKRYCKERVASCPSQTPVCTQLFSSSIPLPTVHIPGQTACLSNATALAHCTSKYPILVSNGVLPSGHTVCLISSVYNIDPGTGIPHCGIVCGKN